MQPRLRSQDLPPGDPFPSLPSLSHSLPRQILRLHRPLLLHFFRSPIHQTNLVSVAVQTILARGVLEPLPETFHGVLQPILDESSPDIRKNVRSQFRPFMHEFGEKEQMSDLDESSPDIGKNVRSQFRPFMHEFGEKEQISDLDLSLLPGTGRRQSNPLVFAESEMRSCGSCRAEENIMLLNLFG
ncbi:hypothetical protein K1719_032801 [Acacia pycnantha]|nr:hypothetical protein K1719_032801 [Acacia pycnantha]